MISNDLKMLLSCVWTSSLVLVVGGAPPTRRPTAPPPPPPPPATDEALAALLPASEAEAPDLPLVDESAAVGVC